MKLRWVITVTFFFIGCTIYYFYNTDIGIATQILVFLVLSFGYTIGVLQDK